jgi:predicted dehydrogenase
MSNPAMINIAIVGLGYWGPNLARNLASLPNARLHTLCDQDAQRLQRLGSQYPDAIRQSNFDAVLNDTSVDAVVIATPVQSHFALAAAALRAGKHVLVEKPLAQTSEQCLQLIALAEERDLRLMVGHVFLYNAAVRKVKEYIDSGELGEIFYIYSQRLNLGIIRQDVDVLWNFAPHDISILCYWLGAEPERVFTWGHSYIQPGIDDIVFMMAEFPNGIGANIHLSWLDPSKVRRMTIVGSRKMVVYDDVSADAKIVVYDKGVVKENKAQASLGTFETFGEFQLRLRAGDVMIPQFEFVEPLRAECQHFVDCIINGQRPLSDGYDGLRVVRSLEAAERIGRAP